MGAALKFKQSEVARQAGEQARLKVVRGPDQGALFVVTGARVTIGRGEDNDIVLSDLRASRRHAALVLGPGGWSVQDMGSANGIAWNGRAVRTSPLKTKDTISLGETMFEFIGGDAPTMMLVAPASTEQQIQREQAGLQAQKKRVAAMAQIGGVARNLNKGVDRRGSGASLKSAFNVPAMQGQSKRKMILIGAVLALGYLLMNSPEPQKPKPAAKKQDQARDLASYLPQANESPEIAKTAEMFYKAGFREYRLGNYLRAKTQFETVLQMSPTHKLAQLYLDNCNQRIEEEVKQHLEIGRKCFDSGKLSEARGHFEAVMRLMYRDQTNPAFVEAKDQLERVAKAEEAGGSG